MLSPSNSGPVDQALQFCQRTRVQSLLTQRSFQERLDRMDAFLVERGETVARPGHQVAVARLIGASHSFAPCSF